MAAAAAAAAAVATAAAVAGVVPSPNRVYYVVDPKEVMALNQAFMCPFLARYVLFGVVSYRIVSCRVVCLS